jgi:hypothetical protein
MRSGRLFNFLATLAGLLLCVVTATGCPRMVSLDYQPNNPLRGQGTVGTAPFRYQASDEHRVRLTSREFLYHLPC